MEFRVATFNVFNLVSAGIPYYNRPAYSAEEFEEKTAWIGRQLDEMEADVIGFQEVFRKDALQAALQKSERFGAVEPIVLSTNEAESPAHTPAVALASRFEVIDPEPIELFPTNALIELDSDSDGTETIAIPIASFSRPVLKAQIRVNADLTVTVFVTHLKSKRPTYLDGETSDEPLHRTVATARSLFRRTAEAAALRSLIVGEIHGNDTPAIVLGDVNDGTLAVTTQMVAGEPPFFRLQKDQKEPYWDVLLYTAQQIQATESTRDTYFTHIFNGSYEALDHIMVSEEFYGRNPDRVGEVDYVRTFNDHIIDEMQSFDEITRTRSDHGMVVAKIRLRT